MHLPRPDIFISATSADLAPMRDLVKKAVLDLGAFPIEQEHFAPAGKTVGEMLREKIAASHALIHLVGECYGAEDESTLAARAHRTYGAGRRSYTQLEHDLAKKLRKPIYIFLCGENFPYGRHACESEEKRALQAEHRARLLSGERHFTIVHDPAELRENIQRIETRLKQLAEKLHAAGQRETLVIQEIQSLRAQNEKLTDLVQAVLEKAGQGAGPAAQSGALVGAQMEVARERGWTLEELRERLTDAAVSAAERVRLADTIEQIATAARDTARLAKRTALHDLGDAAMANLRYAEAVEHYRQSAALYDRENEPLPWADAQGALGEGLWRDGQYAASAEVWQQVLAESEQHLGADDPHTLEAMNELALARHYLGDHPTAEPLYRRALAARERVLGAEHPETLKTSNNLAVLLYAAGEYAAAEPLLRRALEVRERILGAEHPETLTSVNSLAGLRHAQGDPAAAEALARRALAGQERTLGAEHPETLISANNLGVMLRSKGEYAAAEPLLQRVLTMRGRTLGKEHPDTCQSAYSLAKLQHQQGKSADAKSLAWQAYRGLLQTKGAEHQWTQDAQKLLIDLGEKVEE